ncbi:hypothetical protein K2173_020099 [Erythroxylum novogranatense]|uniref:1,8-cineole synthase n=1 Tax=Erythroxylum novogranatense TaxID=1862640 RepID=A0AAV8UAU9_9ROSI|nr:hypothetical protein K2173_020099 [Erythroxylum novogranatense]
MQTYMGRILETSPTTIATLFIRNLVTSVFIYVDKSLHNLSYRFKLLEHLQYIVITSFLLFIRLLSSFSASFDLNALGSRSLKPPKNDEYVPISGGGDSGIARALSQLFTIVNDVPVSSRKYEIVRSLAERLIDENHKENVEALREVNRTVLSVAFSRTLSQLGTDMTDLGFQREEHSGGGGGRVAGPVQVGLNRVLRAVRYVGEGALFWGGKARDEENRCGSSAEKLAAELLWLAQKMVYCGLAEEAVCMWASASNVAWLALSAEPRLQGLLVKASAFLLKEARNLGLEEMEEGKRELQRQTKLKMLMSWLPLLCRASNGTDVPVLNTSERTELERVLEELIEMVEREEDQEQVLSLWLSHFSYSPSSDWPNLYKSYARWCTASRKLLIL